MKKVETEGNRIHMAGSTQQHSAEQHTPDYPLLGSVPRTNALLGLKVGSAWIDPPGDERYPYWNLRMFMSQPSGFICIL